ncbi:Hypothetical predicted protein [Paramuricea clavata]|uniref:Uncharacterized protein n=1 Tax=Paramuricea clavata TaxID=317549 RepID=A0A6S7L034_PARCT|nr:Hypothetical predicted protein [Paramuricea clavata]
MSTENCEITDTKKLSFSEKRSNNRSESTLSAINKSRTLEGLLYILRQLLAKCDGDKTYGYLPYEDAYDKESFSRFDLNADTLKHVLQSLDTEYDKSVLKAMIFATSSRRKVYELGIKPENAVHFLAKAVYAFKECEDAVIAAEKTIKEKDKARLEQLNENIEAIEN